MIIITKILANIRTIGLVAFMLLVFAVYYLYDKNQELSYKVETEEQNRLQYMHNVDNKIIKIITNNVKKELEKNFPHLDSLIRANNIKSKNVTSIMNVKNVYVDSSKIITYSQSSDTSRYWNFLLDTNCIKIDGIVDSQERAIIWKERSYNNPLTIVDYQERREHKIFGITTRLFGKKQYKRKTISKCGDIKTEQIIFEKK